ncbi:hypothetical protein AVEN_129554-1 [Araneus ventricosus]|uniref:Methyltransferase domain-containing protein n=1 Tax=Araneus ventricosus TaxID=182803 RepID=A0A4Y2T1X3_ARAVE|nr:hypothetical protein AVEN_152672-1 [Araneus ventricosus]GBN93548.1 hypothetical protein AVEN_129554-1 [Araneus ventricosus]
MGANPIRQKIFAGMFIDHCKDMFGWSDLSRDVIMDVGCGGEGYCGEAILQKFPDVGTIITIDSRSKVVRNIRLRTAAKMECLFADIEKRQSLRNYEGKMTKVIATHVFHQLREKEEAFRNVYHLLKPGGEAAVLFVMKSLIYEWLTDLLKKPKWKEAYKLHYAEDMYESGFGADQYREMVEKIGFQVVECVEENRVIPYLSDQSCKEALYEKCGYNFNVPPESLEEFKEECLQVLLKLSARDAQGRPCYRLTELSLLLTKPTEGAGSKTKENLGS